MKHTAWCTILLLVSCSLSMNSISDEQYYQPRLLATGFVNPEGPVQHSDGSLYLVEVSRTKVYRVAPDGTVSEPFDTGGNNNSVTFDADGDLIIACRGRRAILRIDHGGTISVHTAVSAGDSLLGPNDMAWDGSGRLYFTDPGRSNANNRIGNVHFIDRDGATHRFAGGLAYPNGLTFSPDGDYLYVAESQAHRILRYEVNPDGSAGEMSVFYVLPEGHTPDGMKVDVEGNLWTTVHQHAELWQLSPAGKKKRSVTLPSNMVSNLTFGGDDMKTVYATCPEDKRNPTGCVYTLRVPVAGMPVVPGK